MKRVKMCALLLLLLTLAVGSTACVAIVRPYPEDGKWYCEELDMVLDFSASVAEVIQDGETVETPFQIDHGSTLFVEDPNAEYGHLLRGSYRLRDDVFTVKTDEGETYTFVRIETL